MTTETTYPYAVWGTQGGGLVRKSGDNYVFVEAPDPSTGLDVGDLLPEEWGLAVANDLAREEMSEFDDAVKTDVYQVEKCKHADDIVGFLFIKGDICNTAAEKLLKMWEEGHKGGVTLHHLAYVGDHAGEPHKSKANQIIRANI